MSPWPEMSAYTALGEHGDGGLPWNRRLSWAATRTPMRMDGQRAMALRVNVSKQVIIVPYVAGRARERGTEGERGGG